MLRPHPKQTSCSSRQQFLTHGDATIVWSSGGTFRAVVNGNAESATDENVSALVRYVGVVSRE